MGPCFVGKSLIAKHLADKTKMPMLDIDDLLFFIEADYYKGLTHNPYEQKMFEERQLKDLAVVDREPLDEKEKTREKELVHEFVGLYNYYYELFGGLKEFYPIFYDYHLYSKQKITSISGNINNLNNTTLRLINKIFELTDTSFVISPPASFGWNTNNPLNIKSKIVQKNVGQWLDRTKNVLLLPGQDYTLRTFEDDSSVNTKCFLRHLNGFYDNADLIVSTNGFFNNPEDDFLKQRTWINVRETMAKERLLNRGEIDNMCDQILDGLSVIDENINEKTI